MERFLSSEANKLFPLLAAFDALAIDGTVTGAATALGVPQSSLSRRIRAAEEALGVPLVQNVGRRVELTPQGRELHERTRTLLHSLDETVRSVSRDADPEVGLVRFGFPLSLSPLSIPGLIAEFHERYPRIRLHVVQAYGEELVRQLRDGQLDLAVVIPAPEGFSTTVLGHQPIDCYVSRGHRLAGKESFSLAELADEDFIANPPSYHLRVRLDEWCAQAGFSARVPFEITEFDTIRELTAKGLGVSLLPPPESEQFGLVRIPLVEGFVRSVGLSSALDEPTVPVRRLHHFLSSRSGSLARWISPA
ncbi:LysR family transcriptional regulator [Dietzia sp.]|uniref:LysR family transcriptional regulator n=1 Tax=Dietzia sp. TaxID=1871616 RepID=UPI002FD9A93B